MPLSPHPEPATVPHMELVVGVATVVELHDGQSTAVLPMSNGAPPAASETT